MLDKENLLKFNISGTFINLEQITDGNINKTYKATFEENNKIKRYLIQQINNYVFKNPYQVMENISNVTDFINDKLSKSNDNLHSKLKVIKTKDNKNLLVVKNQEGKKEYYRAYNFIENAICYNNSNDYLVVKNAGKAFGNFQKLLCDYPINTLNETIKDFHNTVKRFVRFKEHVKLDTYSLVNSVENEIDYILSKEKDASLIINALNDKKIPLRVTHNDTKVNNVMMDKNTSDYLAVIDLDTVMPGSSLYDYADGIRSAASNAKEDEKDLSKVYLKNDLFEAYTEGYMSEVASFITDEELNLMGKSILIITIELALRFLDDYITGSKYFKCDYKEHNLDRAKNQIKLAKDIESKEEYLNEFIIKAYKNNV